MTKKKKNEKIKGKLQETQAGRRILTTLVPDFNHLHMWVPVILRHQLSSCLGLHYS